MFPICLPLNTNLKNVYDVSVFLLNTNFELLLCTTAELIRMCSLPKKSKYD